MDKEQSAHFVEGLLRINRAKDDRTLSPSAREALNHIPQQTVYHLPQPNKHLQSEEKVLLTRKANQLFSCGEFATAQKIYLTVGYDAGLRKLAEHYMQKRNFLQAYLLFQAANEHNKETALRERFVAVLKKWLKD